MKINNFLFIVRITTTTFISLHTIIRLEADNYTFCKFLSNYIDFKIGKVQVLHNKEGYLIVGLTKFSRLILLLKTQSMGHIRGYIAQII